jgi:hypothetical protein
MYVARYGYIERPGVEDQSATELLGSWRHMMISSRAASSILVIGAMYEMGTGTAA